MVALPPSISPHFRNGSTAGTPHHMESLDGSFIAGVVVRVSDNGLTAFRYNTAMDPLDPAAYTTQDLSAIPAVVAALGLADPGNGVSGIVIEDDHFMVGCGLDDQGRMWIAGNGHADNQRVCFSDAAAGVPNFASWNTLTYASMPWSASGANAHTYNQFNRMSDGRLLWFFDQQESTTSSRGRDILGYYLPTGRTKAQIQAGGTSGWRPILDTATGAGAWTGHTGSSRGEICCSENVPNSPVGESDDPNDPGPANRAYVNASYVERRAAGDRLWLVISYRTTDTLAGGHQDACIGYTDVVGLNSLTAWKYADGTALTMPFNWDTRSECVIFPQPNRTAGPHYLSVKEDGGPVIVVQNGQDGFGINPNFGAWVRLERFPGSPGFWQMVNLGQTNQGHPSQPRLVCADGRRQYTFTTGTGQVRFRSSGGQVGGPSGTIPNGMSPPGIPWTFCGPVTASGLVAYGTQTANYIEQFSASCDPVALSRTGRVNLLVPDGDAPRIYSFGNHARRVTTP